MPPLGKPLLFYNRWCEKNSRWVQTTDLTQLLHDSDISDRPQHIPHQQTCCVVSVTWTGATAALHRQWAILQQQSKLLAKLKKQNMKALYQYWLKLHPPYIQTLNRHYTVSYWTIRSTVKQLCKVSKIISVYNNTGKHTCTRTCHSLLSVSDTQAHLQSMARRHERHGRQTFDLTASQLCTDHRQYWQTNWKQSSWAYNTGDIHSLLLLLLTCILSTLRATSSRQTEAQDKYLHQTQCVNRKCLLEDQPASTTTQYIKTGAVVVLSLQTLPVFNQQLLNKADNRRGRLAWIKLSE